MSGRTWKMADYAPPLSASPTGRWVPCTEDEFDEAKHARMINGIFHRWELPGEHGPWVLKCWDPDADDNRGCFHEVGNYRERGNAQRVADEHNAKVVARINEKATIRYQEQMKRWREFKRDDMPVAPVLLVSLDEIPVPKYANARWGGKYSYRFMEVAPMEFEDD